MRWSPAVRCTEDDVLPCSVWVLELVGKQGERISFPSSDCDWLLELLKFHSVSE
jgi:hypothetical protein